MNVITLFEIKHFQLNAPHLCDWGIPRQSLGDTWLTECGGLRKLTAHLNKCAESNVTD